jgi:hypothetical protein
MQKPSLSDETGLGHAQPQVLTQIHIDGLPSPELLLEKSNDAALKPWTQTAQRVMRQEGHWRTGSKGYSLLAHMNMLNWRPIPSDYCDFLSKEPNCMANCSTSIWVTAQNMPLSPITGEMNMKAKSSSKEANLYTFLGIYIWLYWGSRVNRE